MAETQECNIMINHNTRYKNRESYIAETPSAMKTINLEQDSSDVLIRMDMSNITRNQSKKRTRERMSDQEAKDLKAEAREIMPQPSTVNCKKPQSKPKPISIA
ncbi:hypothetical protein Tco_1560473 [Tanacetum coccineum]